MASPLPFFGGNDPSHAMAILRVADTDVAPAAIATARQSASAVQDAEAQAKNALHAASRVPDYPRAHLDALQAQADRAMTARTRLVGELRAKMDARERAARARFGEELGRVLARPAEADPVADQLAQQDVRARLEGMDAGEREVMLRHAAREGGPAQRPLLRAALGGPAVPWASTTFPSVVSDATARELRETLVARAAPSLVEEVWTIRGLRKIADELELTPWTPPAGGRTPPAPPPPALIEFDVLPSGVRIARP